MRKNQHGPTPAAAADGRQAPSSNWWHAPVSSTSWAYEPEKASPDFAFAKPPHYHFSLFNERTPEHQDEDVSVDDVSDVLSKWNLASNGRIADEDDALNEELIGVKSASELLKAYESTVGFDCSPWPCPSQSGTEKAERLYNDVSESEVQLGKEQWDEMVENLIGRTSLQELLKEGTAERRLVPSNACENHSTSSTTSVDYFSRPSTPKPFRLNPSASSFVPLGSPISTLSSSSCGSTSSDSSDSLVLFSFPSPTPSFPPPTNNKIAHQEYVNSLPARSRTTSSDSSSVVSNERPSSNFLPPFLFEPTNQRRRGPRSSRTRAIVDQLRSQHLQDVTSGMPTSQESSPTVSDSGFGDSNCLKSRLGVSEDAASRSGRYSAPPHVAEEHQRAECVGDADWNDNVDGWSILPASVPVDPETKRSRSKELLMTLRRRTDSLSSNASPPGSLPVQGARSLGLISASAPQVILEPERLVGSPEPTEDQTDHQEVDEEHLPWTGRVAQPQLRTKPRNSSPLSHRSSPDLVSPSTPDQSYTSTRNHGQRNIRSQACSAAAVHPQSRPITTLKYPTGYFATSTPGIPYTLMGFPLSMPGVPMTIPMSVPMAMAGNPHTTMSVPVPVQVPVQTMQYSTLMHLRIMQQMQLMRNSMNMNMGGHGGPANASR